MLLIFILIFSFSFKLDLSPSSISTHIYSSCLKILLHLADLLLAVCSHPSDLCFVVGDLLLGEGQLLLELGALLFKCLDVALIMSDFGLELLQCA